jgi:hypothetical protein
VIESGGCSVIPTIAPLVRVSKPSRLDDAVASLDIELTDDEVAPLKSPYTPRATAQGGLSDVEILLHRGLTRHTAHAALTGVGRGRAPPGVRCTGEKLPRRSRAMLVRPCRTLRRRSGHLGHGLTTREARHWPWRPSSRTNSVARSQSSPTRTTATPANAAWQGSSSSSQLRRTRPVQTSHPANPSQLRCVSRGMTSTRLPVGGGQAGAVGLAMLRWFSR